MIQALWYELHKAKYQPVIFLDITIWCKPKQRYSPILFYVHYFLPEQLLSINKHVIYLFPSSVLLMYRLISKIRIELIKQFLEFTELLEWLRFIIQ